jgi:tRNA C32,U32 (ribose-2'-O)-methylase TrmJ
MDIFKDVGMFVITSIVGVIAYFLRQKDEKQQHEMEHMREMLQKQISVLFVKHDEDALKLAELKERIAKEHYMKNELDNRFDRMENSFRNGFNDISGKLDKLTSVMMDHIAKGNK